MTTTVPYQFSNVTTATGAQLDADFTTLGAAIDSLASSVSGIGNINPSNITNLCHPSLDGSHRDLRRAGWIPYVMNQQWGGAQYGVQLPDGSFGDVATGNVQDDTTVAIGAASGNVYGTQGFKVAENMTNPIFLVKLTRTGNPTDNNTFGVWSDNGSGSPSALLGTTATITSKLITSKADGELWAVQPAPGALTAGTQYHLVATRSGAVDASNFVAFKATASRKYPHGFLNNGTATPTWTQQTGYALCFQILNPTANACLQSGGMFSDAKYVFLNGAQFDQSKGLIQPLRNFWDAKSDTLIIRGGPWVAGTPIADFLYGTGHDRLFVGCDVTTGYLRVVLIDSAGTANTITTTTAVNTGTPDIAIKVRTRNDGADYLYAYVNGASVGTPITATSFNMDPLWRELGHAVIGGSFSLDPTWTQSMTFASLPSAQGFTYTGTATEANAYSVNGNKLYLSATGAGANTAYYSKSALGLTAGVAVWKGRIETVTANGWTLQLENGSKKVIVTIYEYYLTTNGTGATDFIYQDDFKTNENVIELQINGSDYFVFKNGKLIVDGTGKATTASANNTFTFGNISAAAAPDVVTSYIKYYTGTFMPSFATGAALSEAAFWSGDKSALLPTLYNSGSPISVKQICGVGRNYTVEQAWIEVRRGVTSSPSTASTTPSSLPEMEIYSIGEQHDTYMVDAQINTTGSVSDFSAVYIDGVLQRNYSALTSIVNVYHPAVSNNSTRVTFGLHRTDGRAWCGAGTVASLATIRILKVEAK